MTSGRPGAAHGFAVEREAGDGGCLRARQRDADEFALAVQRVAGSGPAGARVSDDFGREERGSPVAEVDLDGRGFAGAGFGAVVELEGGSAVDGGGVRRARFGGLGGFEGDRAAAPVGAAVGFRRL